METIGEELEKIVQNNNKSSQERKTFKYEEAFINRYKKNLKVNLCHSPL